MQWGELTRRCREGQRGGWGHRLFRVQKEGLLLPSRACALLWTCRGFILNSSSHGGRRKYANVSLRARGGCARYSADGNTTPYRILFGDIGSQALKGQIRDRW
jgi:hypothetical protein